MKLRPYSEFRFSATHSLEGYGPKAAEPHKHDYVIEVWFEIPINQDTVKEELEAMFGHLRDANLNEMMTDSSDEGLARYFFNRTKNTGRFRIVVRNGIRGGVEALL